MGAKTILTIDDDESVRKSFTRILQANDFDVMEAEDGSSGLEMFRERPPNAVLLDLRMPGMSGLDVLTSLVSESPETPIIVVSGEETIASVVEALRRGAWDYVTKPLQDSQLLLRAIKTGLEKASLLRQNREYGERLRVMHERLASAYEVLRTDEEAARQLQFQLLPEDGLKLGSYTCSRRLYPSQLLSGDFVDYFPLGDRFLGFYIADVVGHGTASAFMTAILTTLVGKYREALSVRGDETILNPKDLLSHLDADLAKYHLEKHITMFFGVLEIESGKIVYSSAGTYPYPVLCNGPIVRELACPGRPLNLLGSGIFLQAEATLEPGGRLLLLSDGVLELFGEKSQHEKRDEISRLVRRSHIMGDVLTGLMIDDGKPLDDDIAVLFLSRKENP